LDSGLLRVRSEAGQIKDSNRSKLRARRLDRSRSAYLFSQSHTYLKAGDNTRQATEHGEAPNGPHPPTGAPCLAACQNHQTRTKLRDPTSWVLVTLLFFRISCCLSGYAGFGVFRISYYFITGGGHRPHQFDPDFVTSNPRLLPKYHFHSIQCHAVIALTVSEIMLMREGEKVMELGALDPPPPLLSPPHHLPLLRAFGFSGFSLAYLPPSDRDGKYLNSGSRDGTGTVQGHSLFSEGRI
jgi:hypothetical protein